MMAAGAQVVPVDSEHNAVFQCFSEKKLVKKIMLTASGGPFRTTPLERLHGVTPEQACAHPNWVMGRKISVDSATMMNKALEVIEARFLFGLAPQRLEVVIHPQSVIHSMVQYRDASVVAQLGTPDMRVPIAYGLAWPDRVASGAQPLDFHTLADMTFESMDSRGHGERFPGLRLAWDALGAPAGTTAVLNAANEVAVAAFLQGRVRFDQIHQVNVATLEAVTASKPESLEDLLGLDARSREAAHQAISRLRG
jgi:1-deoxy-D-xylulose-5-phosphate reductoisomerase